MNNHLARAVIDWKWWFHGAMSEIGIRSSWDPLVQVAMTGGAHSSAKAFGTSEREERRRAAVWRHARIEKALRLMHPDHVSLIRLTCEDHLLPLRLAFGDLGNAAHLTEAARKALRASRSTRSLPDYLDRLSVKRAAGRAVSGDLNAIEAIRLGCEELMGPAREDYVRALGAIPQRRAA